jgi:hypothetical protein
MKKMIMRLKIKLTEINIKSFVNVVKHLNHEELIIAVFANDVLLKWIIIVST